MVGMGVRGGVQWLVILGAIALAAVGCADASAGRNAEGPGRREGAKEEEIADSGDAPASVLRERPWEVVSKRNETYLANAFYADPIENEQIMPWTIDGRAQIDRLVYPTIGNPNLYVKSDPEDELVIVLRLEPNAYDHLAPSLSPEPGSSLSQVTLHEDEEKNIAFFLVAKSARASAEARTAQAPKAGVYQIVPSKILQNPEPEDMPAELKKRHTLRFVFDKERMAHVPPGLYDARFEVRKRGELFANVYEYQYNAVRVFEDEPEEYTALNVTDTQVSTGFEYKTITADKLDDFVDEVNASKDPEVKKAAFITFNGDLHNGGSPGSIRQRVVARTYAEEAKRILDTLKRLELPIFLTAGNHDGYAAIGHVPSLVKTFDEKIGDSLEKVVGEQNNIAWPDFSFSAYAAFLERTASKPGGLPVDIHAGAFRRRPGDTFSAAFEEVPRKDRNMVLYDGFYQWQKTYGPLYASWTFGRNRWISVNSYDLRQHRRTGWGMYTVNYGGAVSKTQLEWIDRELARGKMAGEDVILLMHHDPRGGHKGVDHGYYHPMLDFRGIAQSTINYLLSDKLVPLVCKQPEWSLSVEERDSCLHDGLQEWMAPDPLDKDGAAFFMSGIELLRRFVESPNARTLVLGHVHFNALEVLQPGDVLVPNRLSLDPAEQKGSAYTEIANPVRRLAWEEELVPGAPSPWRFEPPEAATARGPIETSLTTSSFDRWREQLDAMLSASTPKPMTTMSSSHVEPHELAILRFTSGAELTSQTYDGKRMYGYSVMHVTRQSDAPRINRLTYFIHAGTDAFSRVQTIDVDRTRSIAMRGAGNPVDALFDW
jgi:hypothetical protein